MNRAELIELTRKIMRAEGTEAELDEMMDKLERNVPDPNVIGLIYNLDRNSPATPEEVVDKAFTYKPFAL
jgi:hypothetical protein